MKKIVLALSALLALSGALRAADLPLKNPPARAIQFPYTTSGVYFGVSSLASSTSPTVDGNTQGNLQAFGASLGLVVGYRWGDDKFGIAVESGNYWNNVSGDTVCSLGTCTVGARFTSLERVKLATDMQTIVALFPNIGLPNLPIINPQILANISDQRFYIFFGADVDDVSASAAGLGIGKAWQFSPGFGLGTELLLKNLSAVDIWAGYFNPAQGFTVGPVQASQGRKMLVGSSWLF